MDIWFGNQSSRSEEFDRAAKLKAALFDFFADHSKTPPVMNYISMVSLLMIFFIIKMVMMEKIKCISYLYSSN